MNQFHYVRTRAPGRGGQPGRASALVPDSERERERFQPRPTTLSRVMEAACPVLL